MKFYGYASVAGIEFVLSVLGWIAVYNHIRSITKLFTYWIIVHLVIIAVVFWVSTLFDYLHYAFFIAWIVVQIVLIALLWKFKQVLKMVYGWGDDAEPEEEEEAEKADEANEPVQEVEAAQINPSPVVQTQETQNKNSNASVNVSINLSMPQQPAVPVMYAQPQPMSMPMQSAYGQMMPAQQQMMYSQYPRVQNGSMAQSHRGSNAPVANQQNIRGSVAAMNSLSDIAKSGDLPSEQPEEESQGNETDEEMFKTPSPGRVQETYQGNGGTRFTVGNEDDEGYGGEGAEEIVPTDTDVLGLGMQTNSPQGAESRPRMKTPDPPPPPNGVQLQSASMDDEHDDDDDVLHDDFVVEVEPNQPAPAETKGVNLYFLDPGDEVTKGNAY